MICGSVFKLLNAGFFSLYHFRCLARSIQWKLSDFQLKTLISIYKSTVLFHFSFSLNSNRVYKYTNKLPKIKCVIWYGNRFMFSMLLLPAIVAIVIVFVFFSSLRSFIRRHIYVWVREPVCALDFKLGSKIRARINKQHCTQYTGMLAWRAHMNVNVHMCKFLLEQSRIFQLWTTVTPFIKLYIENHLRAAAAFSSRKQKGTLYFMPKCFKFENWLCRIAKVQISCLYSNDLLLLFFWLSVRFCVSCCFFSLRFYCALSSSSFFSLRDLFMCRSVLFTLIVSPIHAFTVIVSHLLLLLLLLLLMFNFNRQCVTPHGTYTDIKFSCIR